jgi:hypothetical protein
MTDKFLVKKFSEEYKWIEKVYNNTSGYIHLSEKHLFANVANLNPEDMSFIMKVSDRSDNVPDKFKIEAWHL